MKKNYFLTLGLSLMATCSFAQVQLNTNGSFEDWTGPRPTNWLGFISDANLSSIAKITNDASHGTNSIEITAPATGNIAAGYIDIPVTAGYVYQVSYDYKDLSTNAKMRHWGQWRTSTAAITTNEDPFKPDLYNDDSQTWRSVTATSTAPATATVLRFDFRVYSDNNAGGGKVRIDNVVIKDMTTLSSENFATTKMTVSPNPFQNVVNITPENGDLKNISVWSLDGKLVREIKQYENQVSLEGVSKGIYIMKVETNNGQQSFKITKN